MTKFHVIQKQEDLTIVPENPDEVSAVVAQTGWDSKLLGRLMDRVGEAKGVPWYQDTPLTALSAKVQIDANRALGYKPDVKATTTANITLSGNQTLDTVALVDDDRVLVKDQTDATQNGIWLVKSGAWARAAELDEASDFLYGVTVRVRSGSTPNAGQFYYLSSTPLVALGTTPLTFTIQPGAPSAVADASSTQKGATQTSVNPVSSTAPIVYGANDPVFESRIDGLTLTWDSATSLGVETGACWVPAANRMVNVASRLTLTGITTPGVNTKQYVYLVYNTTTAAVTLELSTTAPVLYKGFARIKGGPDTTRRYLGMVLGNAAGTALYKWLWLHGDRVMYQENVQIAPFILTDGATTGRATSPTNVSCLPLVPAHCRYAQFELYHNHSINSATLSNSGANFTLTNTAYISRVRFASAEGENVSSVQWLTLDTSQQFSYMFNSAPTSGAGLVTIFMAYQEAR